MSNSSTNIAEDLDSAGEDISNATAYPWSSTSVPLLPVPLPPLPPNAAQEDIVTAVSTASTTTTNNNASFLFIFPPCV